MSTPRIGDELGDWTLRDQLTFASPLLFKAVKTDDADVHAIIHLMQPVQRAAHERQVKALSALDHPCIPALLGHGTGEGHTWIAVEPFEGESLADRLLLGSVLWREACPMFQQLSGALEHVHEHGLLHRDICPSKIWLDRDGKVTLIGFDLAASQELLETLDDPPLGEMAYLAPEVIANPRQHPARADLYAFGCVMHETLTGQSAFPAATMGKPAERAQRMIQWKTRSLALDPGEELPDWLRNLVRKSTHPNPDKRLPDVESLVGWFDAAEAKWQSTPTAEQRPPDLAPMAPLELQPTALQGPPRGQAPVSVLYVAAALAGSVTALAVSAVAILVLESGALG